jgi:hypothetical protein
VFPACVVAIVAAYGLLVTAMRVSRKNEAHQDLEGAFD